jgi:uncharacterized protein (DUF302 family)
VRIQIEPEAAPQDRAGPIVHDATVRRPTVVTRTLQVEHVRSWTARSFADVVAGLEARTGVFAAAVLQRWMQAGAPAGGVAEAVVRAIEAMAGTSGIMRLAALDYSAVLALAGRPARAIRVLIGHPLIAARMMTGAVGAGLYAPLSLLVAADGAVGPWLEYDRPSTLLSQFGHGLVAAIAQEFDGKLAALVEAVAS